MERIYLDNAATTFPKPEGVAQAVYRYMTQAGSNINRGCYRSAYAVEETVFDTRQRLCAIFGGSDPKNVVFTKNVTESLNVLLKGFLKPGDRVLTSSMEHNAVMRPLVQLAEGGVSFTRIPCAGDGSLDAAILGQYLTPETRAVVMTHASNVCGTLLPVQEVGEFCQKNGLRFILDCAQTAGVLPIHMEELHIDALAFTGHKGLLGPQGVGGFILKEDMIHLVAPLLSGGTGSMSHTEEVPPFMPDRFEPGTLNLPGIVGLHAGLTWLEETGLDAICAHELALTGQFLERLAGIPGALPVGRLDTRGRTGVVSVSTPGVDPAQVAWALDEDYGIMTRVGLHCAPSAHKTLGTFPTGTVRFSFGWWNTPEQIDRAADALTAILERGDGHGA